LNNNNPFAWGTSCKFIGESCEKTFEDQRQNDLNNISTYKVDKTIVYNVMMEYFEAFKECLALKTVDGAKKANIIRGEMFKIYSKYTKKKWKDNGKIETIIVLIERINPIKI
jgi:hypothetical protein